MNTNAILIVIVILSIVSVVLTFRMNSKMKKSSKNVVKVKPCPTTTIVSTSSQKVHSSKSIEYHLKKHLGDKHTVLLERANNLDSTKKKQLHEILNRNDIPDISKKGFLHLAHIGHLHLEKKKNNEIKENFNVCSTIRDIANKIANAAAATGSKWACDAAGTAIITALDLEELDEMVGEICGWVWDGVKSRADARIDHAVDNIIDHFC